MAKRLVSISICMLLFIYIAQGQSSANTIQGKIGYNDTIFLNQLSKFIEDESQTIYRFKDYKLSFIEGTNIKGYILEPMGESTTMSGLGKRIPEGKYNRIWHISQKYNKAKCNDRYLLPNGFPKLFNDRVSASRAILIHRGNIGERSLGCLLPGTYKSTSIGVQLHRVNPITVSTTATNASTGKNPAPIAKSDAQCKVEFRPTSNYNGMFGFSWYRFGDTKFFQAIRAVTNSRLKHPFNARVPSNDQAFADIMGHHFETVEGVRTIVRNGNNSSLHTDFAVDSQMSRNHRYDYQRIEMPHIYAADPNDPADPKKPENEYYIPCMTLCKGKTAELQLLITVNSSPDKLIFGFDNPKALSEGFLKLSLSEIVSPAVNPMDATQQITVECLKEFSKPLQLNVWAETSDPADKNKKSRHLCGAVNLLPNDLYHQRNIKVVFFNVITRLDTSNLNNPEKHGINANSTQQDKIDALKKYLLQAYINPQIEVFDLDLVDATTNITDGGYTNCCIPDPSNPGSFLSVDNAHNGALEDFLVQKVDPKYEHYFKIFFIPDRHQRLNGFSSGSREKFTVCFYDALRETPAHELLHSLGLPHTFDGSTSRAKYVYEDGMTDNLMDYSHHNSPSTPRQSLFHWQWQSLNIKL